MPRLAASQLALAVGAAVTAACISSCGASRPAPPPSPTASPFSQPVGHAGLPLRQVADLALPDGASRFDYESIDPLRHMLYIAHLDASSIVAVNLATRRVQADLHDIAEVHGVLAVPSLGKLFASATGSGQAVMISEETNRIIAWTPAGAYPDGIAYDPVKQEVFVSDESGGVETVIDARDGHRIATINLGGQRATSSTTTRPATCSRTCRPGTSWP